MATRNNELQMHADPSDRLQYTMAASVAFQQKSGRSQYTMAASIARRKNCPFPVLNWGADRPSAKVAACNIK